MSTNRTDDHPTEQTRVNAIGLLFEVARSIENRLAPQLAEHDLPWLDGGVMIRLWRSPDHRLRMSTLATQSALSNSGLTRIVDRLEVAGLVRREACPTDRRVTFITLTDQGTERIAAFLPGQLDRIEQIFNTVTEAEADAFLTTLGKIRDASPNQHRYPLPRIRQPLINRRVGKAVGMSSPDAATTQHIVRLVGVYDADGTLRGELAYWVGARLGRRHCSLCEITHGSVRQRPEWRARQADLPVPFDTYHRNDQPDAVRSAAVGQVPAVIAATDAGHVVLLGPAELQACDGSIDLLVEAIEQGAERLGLTWPPRSSKNGANPPPTATGDVPW